MKHLLPILLGILSPLGLSGVAQPSGTFQFPSLGGLQSPQAIWDLTGTYRIQMPIEGLGELSFDLSLVQDVRGKLAGPTTLAIKAGTNDLQCTAKVRGTASGPGQDFNASISVSISGTGVLEGEVRRLKGSLNLTLRVDPLTAHLVGSMNGSGTVVGAGSGTTSGPVAFPLPAGMTGGWSLTLNLQPSGTKFLGDAILNLSNGRTLPFALNGTFSTKTGQSNLKLSGVNAGRGAKLNLTATGVPPGLNKVSGNVLGVALN